MYVLLLFLFLFVPSFRRLGTGLKLYEVAKMSNFNINDKIKVVITVTSCMYNILYSGKLW